jgi:hypothetical protein
MDKAATKHERKKEGAVQLTRAAAPRPGLGPDDEEPALEGE